MKLDALGETIVSSIAFASVGLAVFAAALWVMQKLSPFSFRKEIEQDQNVALGVIIAGVMIGISIIVGAAVHG